jgi:hypothetical protein
MTDARTVEDEQLLQRLRRQPAIRERLNALLDIAEDSADDLRLADEAQLRVTHEIRAMGQQLLQSWANNQVQACEQQVRNGGRAYREGKKNSAGTAPSAKSR